MRYSWTNVFTKKLKIFQEIKLFEPWTWKTTMSRGAGAKMAPHPTQPAGGSKQFWEGTCLSVRRGLYYDKLLEHHCVSQCYYLRKSSKSVWSNLGLCKCSNCWKETLFCGFFFATSRQAWRNLSITWDSHGRFTPQITLLTCHWGFFINT